MRRIIVLISLILLIFFAAVGCDSLDSDDNVEEEDYKILIKDKDAQECTVELGTTFNDLLEILQEEQIDVKTMDVFASVIVYNHDYHFYFTGVKENNPQLRSIQVDTDIITAPNDIVVGDSINLLLECYGEPLRIDEEPTEDRNHYYYKIDRYLFHFAVDDSPDLDRGKVQFWTISSAGEQTE